MKKELVLEIIQGRWSPYAFSQLPVDDFKIKAMFEAAGHAPSCFNEQPWMFVYTTFEEHDIFEDYLGFLAESNQLWAKNAWALIVTLARTKFSHNSKPNRFALYDTGMAVANLSLQAMTFDIYIHQMGGFSVEKVREYFRLPEDIVPVSVMAAGFLGDGQGLSPEILRKDELRRPRKFVNDYTFKDRIYNPAF
ncbi:MAG TPA: nitroreductase family protein [Bacteroidales bacterium]|nr:nitroreductase family protein [Bacteroidales bacterium]